MKLVWIVVLLQVLLCVHLAMAAEAETMESKSSKISGAIHGILNKASKKLEKSNENKAKVYKTFKKPEPKRRQTYAEQKKAAQQLRAKYKKPAPK